MTLLPLPDFLEWSHTTRRANSTLLIQAWHGPSYGWACSCLSPIPHLPPSALDSPSSNHTGLLSVPGSDLAVTFLRT